MKTIDEAIKECEDFARRELLYVDIEESNTIKEFHRRMAMDNLQIAEWLKELKKLKEKGE